MAFAPCDIHGGGFKGGASAFYPALVQGTERCSVKLKCCPSCATTLVEWADKHLSLVSEGDTFYPQTQPLACANCGGHLVYPWAFFLNSYPKGAPERQHYGQVCDKCAPAVAEEWRIAL